MKRKEPLRIDSQLIDRTLDAVYGPALKLRMQTYRLTNEIWPKVMGALLSYTADPQFSDGIFSVTILSAPLRQNLSMEKETLIKRLNEELNEDLVKQIILR